MAIRRAMTGDEFRAWQASVGLNGRAAAAALGISDNTISQSAQGDGFGLTVALACSAIAAGLEPWPIEGAESCKAMAAIHDMLKDAVSGHKKGPR